MQKDISFSDSEIKTLRAILSIVAGPDSNGKKHVESILSKLGGRESAAWNYFKEGSNSIIFHKNSHFG